MTLLVPVAVALSSLLPLDSQAAESAGASPPSKSFLTARPADMQWWREARFGLFIHWGPVSLKGTEIGWSRGGERRGTGGTGQIPVEEYDHLYQRFNPTRFDAQAWVAIAKAAGMKYLVFTTRHHDGFSMFDSKLTDYKITNSPFKRDVVAELADACHQGGLRLGFYYSPPDWHHPDYRTENHPRFIQYLHGQLRELCTNYGKVDIIWFDGLGGKAKDWDAENLLKMIRQLQPAVLINNRAGLEADFDTPEQTIGTFQPQRAWESCITIGSQWSYKPNDGVKSLVQCIHTLVRCAGGDGNLLFNVGPMPTGEIEPGQVARLKEMGDWLSKYGESIYATRGGPLMPGVWGASTCKGKTLYVHVLDWRSQDGVLELPPIGKKIVRSSVLTGGKVTVEIGDKGVRLSRPVSEPQEVDTVVALDLDGPAGDIKPLPVPSRSLAAGKKATASSFFQKDANYGPDKAVDDDDRTRWATDAGTSQAWLEVDLGQPAAVGSARISEAYARVREFELQYQDGSEWKTFARGGKIGANLALEFEPVTARRVRLSITKATEGPTLWEFQLFPPRK